MMICPPQPLPLPTIAAVVSNIDSSPSSNPASNSSSLSSGGKPNSLPSFGSVNGIENLLSCPVCLERYTPSRLIPKLLPCHHSFCVACLERLNPEKEQFQCPTCRKPFERPQSANMTDLQTNFYIVAILESRSEPPRSLSKNNLSTTNNDQTVLAGGSSSDVANGLGCRLHSKPLTFYCSTCTFFICNQCIVEHNKAKNHSIEDLDHFIENCKIALADRAAVALAAQEARQQYVKTLKTELENSRETELTGNVDQLFRDLYVKLGEMRRKIDEEAAARTSRINNRLRSEIAKMEAEAERLDTVRRLCEDVRSRNDLRTLSAVFSSQDLVDVVMSMSEPIQTVPRAVLQMANDHPLRDLIDMAQKFVQADQGKSIYTYSEVKRPVIILPKPSNALLSPSSENCCNNSNLSESNNDKSESRDQSLSPIAEANHCDQAQKFTFDQAVPSQNNNGVIEIDNVPVRLREKPARRVASSQHVDEFFKHRSQLFGSTTEENLEIQQMNYAKKCHYRRSLIELRSNHPAQNQNNIAGDVGVSQIVGGQTAKSTPGCVARHQVISYCPPQRDVIVTQHQPTVQQQKSSSTYILSSGHHVGGGTIASNSSSGASSAGDGSSASDGVKLSPPNAGGMLQIADANNNNGNLKTPFIFEIDDADSADASGDDSDRRRNSSSGGSGRHRRTSSTSKLNNKARQVVASGGSPQKHASKEKLGKKFSLGRAISELFGSKKAPPTGEEGRRGEEKVAIRAVPLATTSGGGNTSNTVTSSDSGGDHNSLGDPRIMTPAQMRCVSLESMALPIMSGPPSKSSNNSSGGSSSGGQQSLSPSMPHTALVTSPQMRVHKVSEIVLPGNSSENRRLSGEFSKRLNMHLSSKSKLTGGGHQQPQAPTPSANTRSYYVPREDSMPVVFPSKPSNQVASKPPTYQAVQSAIQTTKSRPVPTATQVSNQEGTEIVNALLVASTASSSHIQFNAAPPSALSRSNQVVENWSAVPTFCQAPVLKFGRQGSAPGAFDWPESIALAPGGTELYVGDFKNHRIEAFNTNGEYLYEFSVRDGMIDYYPGHMAIDPRGDRIIFPWLEKEGTGYIANSLVAFTRDGRYLTKFSHRDFGCPRAVAINGRSEMFVADQQKGCIFVFDRDGRRLRTIGKRGSNTPGEFNHPCHVAVGRNNEILVADQNNNRIQVFDTRGGICEVLTQRFTRPCHCAVDPYGSLMVADGSNKISILSLNTALPSRSPIIGIVESAEDRLRGPRGLAVDNHGSLYVCDVGNFCIKRFDYSDLLPQRL